MTPLQPPTFMILEECVVMYIKVHNVMFSEKKQGIEFDYEDIWGRQRERELKEREHTNDQ